MNGTVSKKGKYEEDEMNDNWYFNDTSGNLKAIFKCNSSVDVTPVLIINTSNDTLLKNGNGKFALDMQKDLPFLFSSSMNCVVEGKVKNNLKTGVFKYTVYISNEKMAFNETYEKGFIKEGKGTILNLNDESLSKIDAFLHSNMVFGEGPDAMNKLIAFLADKQTPFIEIPQSSTSDNDKVFFDIIKNVLNDTLLNACSGKDEYHSTFSYPVELYFSGAFAKHEGNAFPKIKGDIALTVDTSGYVVNTVFNSNVIRKQVNRMNYYFMRIANLAAYQSNGEKVMKNVNIKLSMLIDTLKSDSFHVSYLLVNADSVGEKT